MKTFKRITQILLVLLALTNLTFAKDTAKEIEHDANGALSVFYSKVHGGKDYLNRSAGYVIFPNIKEVGMFIGGKYGEGLLRVNYVTKGYYSITSASVGMQIGAQKYSLIIAFTSQKALEKFTNDDKWNTDVDFNVAMADWNNDEKLDSIDLGSGMVGFVFDSTGMMGNFTMEGTRFERITPDLD